MRSRAYKRNKHARKADFNVWKAVSIALFIALFIALICAMNTLYNGGITVNI